MKLLAIDGNSIMNRAFYGIKLLSNKAGFFTNAITGFINIYLAACENIKPDAIAVAFDLKEPTFRHKKVESYKATRHKPPDELIAQMPVIKDILKSLGIKVLEQAGYEADDILGALSKICADSENECFILTGDRDSFQLINDRVTVLFHGTKGTKPYTPDLFREEYGFEPINIIDLKALMGDSSDNISGVKGIGEKTASAFVKEYETVEKLYEALESGTLQATASVSEKLRNGKNDAFLSKWLVTIALDVPIDPDPGAYIPSETNSEELSSILTGLDMFKTLEKLKLKPSASPKKTAGVVNSPSDENPGPVNIPKKEYKVSALDGETLSEVCRSEDIITFLYANEIIRFVYKDVIYTSSDKEEALMILASPALKYTFQAKPAYRICFENGRELIGVAADADIMGYLLNTSSSEYTIRGLCAEANSPYYEELGENADIASLEQLCAALLKKVEAAGMKALLTDIELPLTETLASMENLGIRIDAAGVKDFGLSLSADIKGLEEQIWFMAGHEFNINSPKQLGTVLFEELSLPYGKKTKTGYSTNADVLDSLSEKHPIVELILRYRQLSKLNSTYVEGLLKAVSPDGRIHSVFKQTETRTGRISSIEPNMQNIPVRTERGRQMRRFFTAKDGYILLDADYSQIELRILASMSGDENMRKGFEKGADIHALTAAQVFDMPPEMVTSEMRRAAKAVNFGIIYGIGAFSLSKDIGVSVAEAKKYIENYLEKYPRIKKFMDDTINSAAQNGYAVTMYGRRRYIPELSSSNKNIQAFGKRAAMNAPIQGTAADIIKIAMVRVYRRLKSEGLEAKLILQVHDELIIESSESDAKKAAAVLEEEMRGAADLSVPLIADVNSGFTWYDAKG